MKIKDLRYFFEHKMLPNYLEKNPSAFIMGVSIEKEAIINRCFEDLCKSNECEYPFKEEDFNVELMKLDHEGNTLMIRIDMPKPNISPECKNIFIIFNDDFTKYQYFTIEFDELVNKDFLCGWKQDSHLNYGIIENSDINEIITKIYMIFKSK